MGLDRLQQVFLEPIKIIIMCGMCRAVIKLIVKND